MRGIGPKDKYGGSNMFIIIGMWPVVERSDGDICCVLRSNQASRAAEKWWSLQQARLYM